MTSVSCLRQWVLFVKYTVDHTDPNRKSRLISQVVRLNPQNKTPYQIWQQLNLAFPGYMIDLRNGVLIYKYLNPVFGESGSFMY
jgi:hypothetical protein